MPWRDGPGGRPLNTDPLGSRVEHSADTFSLLSELAIGIAGFGGVAAAFGGRDRVFKPTEQMRLLGIFVNSGAAFLGSLLWTVAFEAGLPQVSVNTLTSIAMVGYVAALQAPRLPAVFRYARDPDSTSERWVLIATSVYTIALLCAYLVNSAWLASSWVLSGAFSSQLIYSLWMFYRLLTRPN